MSKSLKKDIELLIKEKKLSKILETNHQRKINYIKNFLSDKNTGLIVIPLVIFFFISGQIVKPTFLQIIDIDLTTAIAMIDQRTSNMATIFSITLVVIGWLITNLSIKESLSYELMFQRIYLYPIFYLIISIISSLIFISLLRNTSLFDLGDAIVSGTYLIFIAIIAIVFLFRRLIQVINDSYFFECLEKEILKEIYKINFNTVYTNLGKKLYTNSISEMGFSQGSTSFLVIENNHRKIPIKLNNLNETNQDAKNPLDIIFNEKQITILDVNIDKIKKIISTKNMTKQRYYTSVGIFENVSEDLTIFELNNEDMLKDSEIKLLQSAYKTRLCKENTKNNLRYVEYLSKRIIDDVKSGKKNNVKAMLEIMKKVYEMEDIIKIYL